MKLWRRNPRPTPSTSATSPRKPGLSVERLLQINVAVLVPLGAMMLGMGEREMSLAAIVLIASISSLYLTDLWGWIRLNAIVANVIALVAMGVSITHFIHATSEEQLIAIANLLIYLQVILLFQQKTNRVYWQLLVLSSLEVVVATALNASLLFGVLLVVYLFAALATLGLIFILREAEHHLARARASARKPPPAWVIAAIDSAKPPSRWPLRREIQIVSAPAADLPQRILGDGIFWRTSGIGIGTLIVATVCFFFLPRFGKALVDATSSQSLVGYNPTVKLGDMGPLLQNPELVMQVEFRDATERQVAPTTPLLLRGSLLNHYQWGEWKLSGPAPQRYRLRPPPDRAEVVQQRITIQPMKVPVLFGVYPPYRSGLADTTGLVRYDPSRQQLVRNGDVQSRSFTYDLVTTALAGGRQARIVPLVISGEQTMNDLLQLPDELPPAGGGRSPQPTPSTPIDNRDQLTGLRALAARKVLEARIPADGHYAKAKLLERVLSGPPFEYTLDRPPPEPGIDPIEDFVTRNPRGHCEYFASALTLMLRSQGIPARVVIGFHGGDWNPSESQYDVRQLHSHAWVEAYLSPEQVKKVPKSELPPKLAFDEGAWLVLDPTPLAQLNETFAAGSFMSSIADLSDYLQVLWNTYVIGLNSERQDKAIYQPLAEFGVALKKLASHPLQAIGDTFAHLRHWLFGGGDGSDSGLDWYVLAALVVLALAALMIYRLTRTVVRSGWRLVTRRRTGAAARNRVEFYRRFETLLARHGLRRASGETQLELAHRAAKRLNGSLAAAALPAQLVATFYRIRFGHATLDSTERATVEQLLAALREGLGAKGRGIGTGDKGI